MDKRIVYVLAAVLFFTPLLVGAVTTTPPAPLTDIKAILGAAGDIISLAIGITSSLALLVFIWGIVKYLASAGDEKAKEGAKRIMVWGVIALAVLFSVFGLVEFLRTSFSIDATEEGTAPKVIYPSP